MADIKIDKQTVENQYIADTIIQGVPFETWKADLAEKEQEIRELLISSALNEKEKDDYKNQLADVESQLQDERASYEKYITSLKERIVSMDKLVGLVPGDTLEKAKKALADNDHKQANDLFTQIEEQADPHIIAAAEAAYQRGKLAEDEIKYREALKHYYRATQLVDDDTEYLIDKLRQKPKRSSI